MLFAVGYVEREISKINDIRLKWFWGDGFIAENEVGVKVPVQLVEE